MKIVLLDIIIIFKPSEIVPFQVGDSSIESTPSFKPRLKT